MECGKHKYQRAGMQTWPPAGQTNPHRGKKGHRRGLLQKEKQIGKKQIIVIKQP